MKTLKEKKTMNLYIFSDKNCVKIIPVLNI